jgi:hypothetical protein
MVARMSAVGLDRMRSAGVLGHADGGLFTRDLVELDERIRDAATALASKSSRCMVRSDSGTDDRV